MDCLHLSTRTGTPPPFSLDVIATPAWGRGKQSRVASQRDGIVDLDCFVAALLAMTVVGEAQ